LRFLSSLPDASRKSLLMKLGFGYMLSLMVAYTSRIIMQAISARVIGRLLYNQRTDFQVAAICRGLLGMIPASQW